MRKSGEWPDNGTYMKKPLVSVIIPTYNRGWILKQAVDSVLTQDFEDFELIVVDDGSADHTQKILDSYQRELTIICQENLGVSAARNRGVEAAAGSYIAFLDSDDHWLHEKLGRQVDFFEKNQTALICQTEEIWIRNGRRVNPKKRHKKPSGMIFKPSLALCLVSPSSVMIKKSLFEETGGFDENLPACEDYDLWLRIGSRHPVYLIDIPLTIKRGGHEDQLSRQHSLDKYRIESLNKIISSDLLSAGQKVAAIQMLISKCSIYATGCLKRGRNDEAESYQELASKYKADLTEKR